jgi:gamma-glutamyl:cysteine ligase YbdK (ATP-grasp superfamily)
VLIKISAVGRRTENVETALRCFIGNAPANLNLSISVPFSNGSQTQRTKARAAAFAQLTAARPQIVIVAKARAKAFSVRDSVRGTVNSLGDVTDFSDRFQNNLIPQFQTRGSQQFWTWRSL